MSYSPSTPVLPPTELLVRSQPHVTPDNFEGVEYAQAAYKAALRKLFSVDNPASEDPTVAVQAANWAERRSVLAGYNNAYCNNWHERAVGALKGISEADALSVEARSRGRSSILAMHSASLAIVYRQADGRSSDLSQKDVALQLAEASRDARRNKYHLLATSTLRNEATFEAISSPKASWRAGRAALFGMGNSLKLGNEVAAGRRARILIRWHELTNNGKALGIAVTAPLARHSTAISEWREHTADKLIY